MTSPLTLNLPQDTLFGAVLPPQWQVSLAAAKAAGGGGGGVLCYFACSTLRCHAGAFPGAALCCLASILGKGSAGLPLLQQKLWAAGTLAPPCIQHQGQVPPLSHPSYTTACNCTGPRYTNPSWYHILYKRARRATAMNVGLFKGLTQFGLALIFWWVRWLR